MNLREITFNDYPNLIPFWKENYFVTDMDNAERFKLFLGKNPHLSILIEDDGQIKGTALGSFDGRRGYIQKVVTSKESRGKGIGKQLVDEVVKRLHQLGALYIPIAVEDKNITFYEKCGFKKTNQTSMSL
jgi:ribosomal protein S18 acetylase RimI-like enzyme